MQMIRRLGLAAALAGGLAAPALAADVDVYHDKANWQDAYTKVLERRSGGVRGGALCRHIELPGGGAGLAPDRFRAGHLHLVVGLPDEGPGRRRPRRRREPRCGRSTPTPGSTARRSPRPTPSTARSTASPTSSPTGRCSTTRRSSPRTASARPRPGRSSRRGREAQGGRGHAVRRDGRRPLAGLHLVPGVPRPPGPGPLQPPDERRGEVHRPRGRNRLQDLEGLDRQGLLHRPLDQLRHGRHQRHGGPVRPGQARHDPGRHLVRGDAPGSRHVA